MKRNKATNGIQRKKLIVVWTVTLLALLILFFLAINMGSLKVTPMELFRGLFVEYNAIVATIYDIRFPRILVSILGGGAIAVAGVLFQAVMKNPLADPSMIGVSSGASLTAFFVYICFPGLAKYVPVLAFLGGLLTFGLVYSLSWKKGTSPLRILLVGIAISSVFSGCIEAFETVSSGTVSVTSANMTLKTWADVDTLTAYVGIGFVLALCLAKRCNLLGLEDHTANSLGINMNLLRLLVSIVAVLLTSISTAVFGVITFLGLIVPHMARIGVGSNHKYLIPYSFVLGAFVLLLADTIGRVMYSPYEISATILMAVIGGPFFILLIRRSKTI